MTSRQKMTARDTRSVMRNQTRDAASASQSATSAGSRPKQKKSHTSHSKKVGSSASKKQTTSSRKQELQKPVLTYRVVTKAVSEMYRLRLCSGIETPARRFLEQLAVHMVAVMTPTVHESSWTKEARHLNWQDVMYLNKFIPLTRANDEVNNRASAPDWQSFDLWDESSTMIAPSIEAVKRELQKRSCKRSQSMAELLGDLIALAMVNLLRMTMVRRIARQVKESSRISVNDINRAVYSSGKPYNGKPMAAFDGFCISNFFHGKVPDGYRGDVNTAIIHAHARMVVA